MQIRLVLNSQRSACLCLPDAGIKGVRHHCLAGGVKLFVCNVLLKSLYITVDIDYQKKLLRTSYYKVFGKIFSQKIYNQLHNDLGFPSVCCDRILLPLCHKESALGVWQARIEQGRNSKQRWNRKESGSDSMYLLKKTDILEPYW